jgi:hypothetical protein
MGLDGGWRGNGSQWHSSARSRTCIDTTVCLLGWCGGAVVNGV